MKPLRSFRSIPRVPNELEGLQKLAQNMWWHWNQTAGDLFQTLDPPLWEQVDHNPVLMLERLSPQQLEDAAGDDAFRSRISNELATLEKYRNGVSWFDRTHPRQSQHPLVAYFCAEFGLAEFFRTYSGGLGVLAGDHIKAASDLGLPLVGVGLFYHRGFFQQRLSLDGWQLESYPFNDSAQLPITLVRDASGSPCEVDVLVGGERVVVRIWQVDVGRVVLYLLDTNVPENAPNHRNITDRLYGGDRDDRISQEIVLGIGGVRALDAIGVEAEVFHMNEGHAAFLIVERLRQMVAAGTTLATAMEAVRASNVFTTHTPVPAGNEVFPRDLLERHLAPYLAEIGLSWEAFSRFGVIDEDTDEFGMTIFALRFSSYANGVSRLHGRVSRRMWKAAWGEVLEDEVPIHHVTNGVHTTTWVGTDVAELYDAHIGPGWRREPHRRESWQQLDAIPAGEFWSAHERGCDRLVSVARARLARQLRDRHASPDEIRTASAVLDPTALTLGFARRVATYKRLQLLLCDPDRLHALLTDGSRPMQIVIAGKAHPDDEPAKQIIRSVVEFAARADARPRIVFLEDYDMHLAKLLVAGVDVWVNTPRRPLEASGTSGMKAAANGVLNLSVLDGWWDEAYEPTPDGPGTEAGWAIGGHDDEGLSEDEADGIDSNVLYTLLERDVVPLFHDRDTAGVPVAWVERMKRAVQSLVPQFNSHRMVSDYIERAYLPVAQRRARLAEDGWAGARELGAWKERVRSVWGLVRIRNVEIEACEIITAGQAVSATVEVDLAGLDPEEVSVQIVVGRLNLVDVAAPMSDPATTPLTYDPMRASQGIATFAGPFTTDLTGNLGVTARVLPRHADLATPVETGLLCWA